MLIIATLGYGIYLVHFPVIQYLVAPFMESLDLIDNPIVLPAWLIVLVLTLTLSTLIAYVLHLIVEKPALYLRDTFAK